MPIPDENFIRCACGCADFTEETVLTFHKAVLPRDSKTMKLAAMDTEYHYLCRSCGHKLDR